MSIRPDALIELAMAPPIPYLASLVLVICISLPVLAMPFWESGVRQTSDSSLAGQLSYLIANVPQYQPRAAHSKHLAPAVSGLPGNITLVSGSAQPGLFYLYRHQLYNYVNETCIYPVSAVNVSTASVSGNTGAASNTGVNNKAGATTATTATSPRASASTFAADDRSQLAANDRLHHVYTTASNTDEPLQLVIGEHQDAVHGGRWRWADTRLMYDLGTRTNRGLFYTCPDLGAQGNPAGVFMNMQEYVSYIFRARDRRS